jgi:hypothetical protein
VIITLKGKTKSLVITSESKFYQKENIVDSLLFLLPLTYNDLELVNFEWALNYIDQQGVAHSEILELVKDNAGDVELYKENYLQYKVPVDSKLTQFKGDIEMHLSGVWNDTEHEKKYVMHSGSVTITIYPLEDVYALVDDDTLNALDQRLLSVSGQIQALEILAGEIDEEIPDDLTLTDNTLLQLSVNGNPIGEGVELPDVGYDLDSSNDGVIDIGDTSGDPSVKPDSIAIIDL